MAKVGFLILVFTPNPSPLIFWFYIHLICMLKVSNMSVYKLKER